MLRRFARRLVEGIGITSRQELLWFVSLSLLAVVIGNIPHLYAWWRTEAGDYFLGSGTSSNHADYLTYLMKVEQGRMGKWQMEQWYSLEASRPTPIQVIYPFIGQLARFFSLDIRWAIHLMRLLAAPFLLTGAYALISLFERARKWRLLMYTLMLFPLTTNWMYSDWKWSGGITLPESMIYSALVFMPHFALGLGALLWAVWGFWKARVHPTWKWGIFISCMSIVAIVVYPFALANYYAAIIGFLAFSWLKSELRSKDILAAVMGLPVVLIGAAYYWLATHGDRVIEAWWWEQQVSARSSPILVLGHLGMVGLVALWASFRAWSRQSDAKSIFVSVWFVGTFFMHYFPFGFSNRFIIGLSVPAVILFVMFLKKLRWSVQRPAIFLTLALLTASTFFTVGSEISLFRYRVIGYLPNHEVEMLTALQGRGSTEDVILTGGGTGKYVPFFAHKRVFLGHAHETYGYEQKRVEADKFFGQPDSAWHRQFLRQYGIDYLYLNAYPEYYRYEPAQAAYLTRLDRQGTSVLYQVNQEFLK